MKTETQRLFSYEGDFVSAAYLKAEMDRLHAKQDDASCSQNQKDEITDRLSEIEATLHTQLGL